MCKSRYMILVPFSAFFLTVSSAWADRTILVNDGAAVVAADSAACGSDVFRIRVESKDMDLFEGQSDRMQSLVDSTQAILSYECPQLNELIIEGYLSGLGESVYTGSAIKADGWMVQASSVVSSSEVPEEAPGANYDDRNTQISVATVNLDLTVEEVQRRFFEVFGTDAVYDPESGVMNLEQGNCPRDYMGMSTNLRPQPDWVCVKGWFTDRRVARLYKMHYTQVRERNPDEIRTALIEHFGNPQVDRRQSNSHKLLWTTDSVNSDGVGTREELEATIWKSGNMAVLDLSLHYPDQADMQIGSADEKGTQSGVLRL